MKRAKIGQAKHIRIRPIHGAGWSISGTIAVTDDSLTPHIETLWELAGRHVGIGDWRPSSPSSPGPYGCFTAEVEAQS